MSASISRKLFFRQTLFQAAEFSTGLFEAFQSSSATPQTSIDYTFEADFPPELLVEEAARLGIDPEDRAAVLAAIAERLQLPLK